jgi:hypothetical protein
MKLKIVFIFLVLIGMTIGRILKKNNNKRNLTKNYKPGRILLIKGEQIFRGIDIRIWDKDEWFDLPIKEQIFEKSEINLENTDNQKGVFVTCTSSNTEENLNYFSQKSFGIDSYLSAEGELGVSSFDSDLNFKYSSSDKKKKKLC